MEGLDFLGSDTDEELARLTAKVKTKIQTGATIGAIVGGVALAALWRDHRVWGGLIGLFIAGPAVGGGAGWLAAYKERKRLNEPTAQRAAAPFKIGDRVVAKDSGKAGTVGKVEFVPQSIRGPYYRVSGAFDDKTSGFDVPADAMRAA